MRALMSKAPSIESAGRLRGLGRGRHDDARRQRPYDCRTWAPPRIALYDRDDDPQHGIGQYRNPPQGKGPDPARGDRVRNLGPCGGRGVRAIKHGFMPTRSRGRRRGCNYPRCRCGLYVLPCIDHQPDPATACRPFDADRDGFEMGGAPACSCSRAWNMRRRAVRTFMPRSWATATPMMPITSRVLIPRLPALPARYRWR